MNKRKIVWNGESTHRRNRGDNRVYYNSYDVNKVNIAVGSCVFINNIDSPLSLSGAYIGLIRSFYEKDNKGKFAIVQWFLRSFELTRSAIKGQIISDLEVFFSYANYHSEIKLSSILEPCLVYFAKTASHKSTVEGADEELWKFYCCRGYNGKVIVDLVEPELSKISNLNEVNTIESSCEKKEKKPRDNRLMMTLTREISKLATGTDSKMTAIYKAKRVLYDSTNEEEDSVKSKVTPLKKSETRKSKRCDSTSKAVDKENPLRRSRRQRGKVERVRSEDTLDEKVIDAIIRNSPKVKVDRLAACEDTVIIDSDDNTSAKEVVDGVGDATPRKIPMDGIAYTETPERVTQSRKHRMNYKDIDDMDDFIRRRNNRESSDRRKRAVIEYGTPLSEETEIRPQFSPAKSKRSKRIHNHSTRFRKRIGECVSSDDDGDEDFKVDKESSSSSSSSVDDIFEQFKPKKGQKKLKKTKKMVTPTKKRIKTTVQRTPQSRNRNTKSMRPQIMTPTIPGRARVTNRGSVMEQARLRLHVSALPDTMPCREDEFAEIYEFVHGKIMDNTGGCMYISGVPGTGKTATIHQVITQLTEDYRNGDLEHFKYIEVNAMKLTDPKQAHVSILQQITGQKVTPDHATAILEKRFNTADPRRVPIVLLVDELDLLWTNKQNVMYSIFDWPTRRHAKLTVLAVANTMNLPERLMMNRVSSRLDIVAARMIGVKAFGNDAVQLASRKVAALSGDARRALDICRRATEMAETDLADLVTMHHVNSALQEMFTSPKIVAIRNASLYEKLFLKSVVMEFNRNGIEETVFYKVFKQMVSLSRFEGLLPPTTGQMNRICTQLGSFRIILVENSKNDMYQRIRLNISPDDVNYALKDPTN